jgi:hypothetical protein
LLYHTIQNQNSNKKNLKKKKGMNTKKALTIFKDHQQNKVQEEKLYPLSGPHPRFRTMSLENLTDSPGNSVTELENLRRKRENNFDEEVEECLLRLKNRQVELDIIDSRRLYEINKLVEENEHLKKKIKKIEDFVKFK